MNKCGPKKGSKHATPRPGTFGAALCTIEPGESRFFEPANTLSFFCVKCMLQNHACPQTCNP